MKITKEHRDWSGTKVKCNRCECEAELTVETPGGTIWDKFRTINCPVCRFEINFRDPTRAIELPSKPRIGFNEMAARITIVLAFLTIGLIGYAIVGMLWQKHPTTSAQVEQPLPDFAVEALRKLYASNGMTFTYTNWTK